MTKEYALASATIATHNIWFPEHKDRKNYKKYELNTLINHKQISYREAPLLFLLGLVDTIDPIKIYNRENYNSNYVLDNVKLEIDNEAIKLSIQPGNSLDIDKIFNKVNAIDKWLNIKIQKNCNSLEIKWANYTR